MSVTSFTILFFFASRRRHTRCSRDWSSDVCSSDLPLAGYLQTADIVDHRGGQQQDDKQGIRPAVENVAQKRQGQMPAPAGQPIVNGKGQGQKIEEENLRTEYHVISCAARS